MFSTTGTGGLVIFSSSDYHYASLSSRNLPESERRYEDGTRKFSGWERINPWDIPMEGDVLVDTSELAIYFRNPIEGDWGSLKACRTRGASPAQEFGIDQFGKDKWMIYRKMENYIPIESYSSAVFSIPLPIP
jgi:hypothetical protein